jgi:hypothetical protein
MQIKNSIFEDLEQLHGFKEYVQGIFLECYEGTNLRPVFDPERQEWAWEFWKEDLLRLEPQVNGPPCHLKRAAFLTFWLRREPPIAVVNEISSYDDLPRDKKYQTDFLLQYGREYCALRAGYELALFGQKQSLPGHIDSSGMYGLTNKFIDDTVEFLKRKSVSPHALYLIYLGIFGRDVDRLGTR